MREPYHAAQRDVQDRFDTRRLADRLALYRVQVDESSGDSPV